MAEYTDREHYIPMRQSDIVKLLCQDLGADQEAVERLRRLDTILSATFHYEYYRLQNDLKEAYAPFDPDRVTHTLHPWTPEERAGKLDEIYERFLFLMERANFKRLTFDEIKTLTEGVSDWGLNMDVDFRVFERLEIFVRGDTNGPRYKRRWWAPWKLQEVRVPIFRRLVMFVKLKPSKRLPADVDTNTVFLKIFKDIPKVDMEMLFPGAQLCMPGFQRFKLGSSLFGSGAWIGYTIWKQAVLMTEFGLAAMLSPMAALLGYGYKQWFGYQTTRTAFSLRLTQSLYYQTLGNNQSVLFHLLDEAEEQECREALLAYYYLWRRAGEVGWTAEELDNHVEQELERLAGLKVDFEIGDALAKLERLKLVTKSGERYVAVPIEQALEALDHAWDNYFQYNQQAQG